MFEQILLIIDDKFHGFVLFFYYYVTFCLYNALHIVGAQIFEEERKKDKNERRI